MASETMVENISQSFNGLSNENTSQTFNNHTYGQGNTSNSSNGHGHGHGNTSNSFNDIVKNLPVVHGKAAVENTSQSFKELFKARVDLYAKVAPAAALFYNHNGSTGIRLEVPTLAKEFVDSLPFGRDPEGILFYDNTTDIVGEATYDVFSNYGTTVKPGQEAVVVQFKDSHGTLYAEFVGQDPTRTVKNAFTASGGKWATIEQASVNAKIEKKTKASITEITMTSIGKKVEFKIPANLTGYNEKAISTMGNVFFKSIAELKAETKSRIDYNDDRILFYRNTKENDSSLKDLIAVFIPVENNAADAVALGEFTFQSALDDAAVWKDL